MDTTTKLSSFVLFILIGSTVFSLAFQAVDGPMWVEHLLTSLPGGQLGFLIVVNILIFLLAFFLDFFELAFIIVPLLGAGGRQARHRPGLVRRAARGQHADLVHAPAVRLRAVLPAQRRAAERLRRQDHAQADRAGHDRPDLLGRGAVRLIQIIMVGLIIAFPQLVSSGLGKEPTVDLDKAFQQMQMPPKETAGRQRCSTASRDRAARRAPRPPPRQRRADARRSDEDAMKRSSSRCRSDATKKP